jgi:hypothetical protein
LSDIDPHVNAALDAIAHQPLKDQLDFLVPIYTTGQPRKAPWDSGEVAVWTQALGRAYLERLAIEQTARLTEETSRLTKWLIWLTAALVGLTVMLVILGIAGPMTGWGMWGQPHP